MRHDNAAVRVRRRITEWLDLQGRGSKSQLAAAVKGLYGAPRSSSWVTDLTHGPEKGGQDLRLADLDAVADAMKVPPGDLVRREDNHYLEVTPSEVKLLRYVRALPDVARHHFMAYISHLRDVQQRELDEQARIRDERTAEARRLHKDRSRQRDVVIALISLHAALSSVGCLF